MKSQLSQLTENELVYAAKKGDIPAFEQLIKRYEDRIYSLAYRILRDKEEAFDVLQETAISAFKNLDKFRGKSSFSTWLYRIALNFALMRKRKQKSILKKAQIFLSEDDDKIPQYSELTEQKNIIDWSHNPTINLENEELRNILLSALNKLPEKYRSVIILKELEGKPVEEVSKILGISQSATKTRLHRGRLYLRSLLDKYISQGYL